MEKEESSNVSFGVFVIGPGGSGKQNKENEGVSEGVVMGKGKSTMCQGVQQYLRVYERPSIIVNLDPANNDPPYNVPPSSNGDSPHFSATPLLLAFGFIW